MKLWVTENIFIHYGSQQPANVICYSFITSTDTKFIIIASDGVWEFISNKKAANIVLPFYEKNDPDGACKALIKESIEWWNKEDIVVDDITVICLFF
jgi:serine/threonine protein phosphatase PrpC